MKKCIVQFWIQADQYSEPDYNALLKKSEEFNADEFADRSARSFETYANKYNHDFVRVTEKKLYLAIRACPGWPARGAPPG